MSDASKTTARDPAQPTSDEVGDQRLFDIEHSLGFRMARLINLSEREFQRNFEYELDLSLVEWRVLAVLFRRPGIVASDIARRFGQNQMLVSRAVRKLEELGRIYREQDPNDGRQLGLYLTAEGQRIFRTVSPLPIRFELAMAKGMLPQDLLAFAKMIDQALEALEDLED